MLGVFIWTGIASLFFFHFQLYFDNYSEVGTIALAEIISWISLSTWLHSRGSRVQVLLLFRSWRIAVAY